MWGCCEASLCLKRAPSCFTKELSSWCSAKVPCMHYKLLLLHYWQKKNTKMTTNTTKSSVRVLKWSCNLNLHPKGDYTWKSFIILAEVQTYTVTLVASESQRQLIIAAGPIKAFWWARSWFHHSPSSDNSDGYCLLQVPRCRIYNVPTHFDSAAAHPRTVKDEHLKRKSKKKLKNDAGIFFFNSIRDQQENEKLILKKSHFCCSLQGAL